MKTIPLEYDEDTKNFTFNEEIFKKAFSKKTKVFILNNCHNPTGKVFSKEELEWITDFLDKEYPDVFVISDDVYEFLTFEGNPYHCFASLKNNFRKTYSLFSGGKLFCATGWKLGWTIAPKDILAPAHLASNTSFYGVNSTG